MVQPSRDPRAPTAASSRLIVIGPVPPPYHGVTVSTGLVLANPVLRERFDHVTHLDTSDRRPADTIGRWDVTNVGLGLVHTTRLLRLTGRPQGVVYLPLSQALGPFLRDSLFVLAARRRGWRVAAHLRGSEFRSVLYEHRGWLARAYVRFTLRQLNSLAVMGDSLRSVFDGLVAPDRIAAVSNGTPAPAATSDVKRDDWRVLFLSSLRPRKGVSEAVEAALIVLRSEPRARFLFVGDWRDEEYERAVRARADAAPPGTIEFRDAVTGSEKDALLASAVVFLFPPTAPEGHPRVVLEAMSHGLPIVTTDQGAIRETVADGETGYVLERADPATLAARVLELLCDGERREAMANASRERWRQHFSQERADEVLADWLAGVAAQGRENVSR
jgi:glycosyltransferase involved in cell wall biosynthesis